jgi:hypothetical protein
MILRSVKMLFLALILLVSGRASAYDYQVPGYIGYVEHYNDGSFAFTLVNSPGGAQLSTVCTNGSWPGHVGVNLTSAGNTADGVKAYLASIMLAQAAGRQVIIYANLTAGDGSSCVLVALDSF